MSLIVDGSSWCFDGVDVDDARNSVLSWLDLIECCRDRDESVLIGDDFQSRVIIDQEDIWTALGENGSISLPYEQYQRVIAWLGQSRRYADEENWPEGTEDGCISVGYEAATENFDLAWVHHSVRVGLMAGALSLNRSGRFSTSSSHGWLSIYFVKNEVDLPLFWRDMIVLKGANLDWLSRLAPHAYPDLLFYPEVIADAARLDGGYLAQHYKLTNAFAVLNDFGAWIFTYPPPALQPGEDSRDAVGHAPSNQLIERRFLAFGLIAAPESPDVRKDQKSHDARLVRVGLAELYCEWHIKLELHRNRIHIHGPDIITDGRILVAIIHEHLPLP